MTGDRIMCRPIRTLWLMATAAMALRVALVFSGGQYYWPDENRYQQSAAIIGELANGQVVEPLLRLSNGDHPLFKLVGIPPAYVERQLGDDSRIPGSYLAAFSALDIVFIGLIALRLGSQPEEAILAAGLLAASCSFFYFSRHLVPYDVAMTFGLGALLIGVASESRAATSLWCGVLAGLAFLTYAGYWTLSGVAVLVHVVRAADIRHAVSRAALSAFGLALPILVLTCATMPFGGHLLGNLRAFSSAVDQGDVREGWRLPWEYLWHAEHGLVVLWAAGTVGCLIAVRRSATARIGLAGIALIYVTLASSSTLLRVFVVYGRLARQLVPFFCLVAATALWSMRSSLSSRIQKPFTGLVAALVVTQATFNFAAAFRVTFPRELLRDARTDPRVGRDGSLFGINVHHLYPGPEPVQLPERFALLRREPHPLRFRPYQYEGYTPTQRQVLRSADISMKLLLVPSR